MPRNNPVFVTGALLALLFSAMSVPVHSDDTAFVLGASEWSRPRSAAAVIDMPPVANAVRAWQAVNEEQMHVQLQLVHASGEEGGLWAAELRDWLIALGIPPPVITLVPAGQASGRLELRVTTRSNRSSGEE
ncbi:MAG: hypothetical protein KY410_06390 [Proteobacteria bacterium]|nr:hypothetical protein [Pseudomonadota bacterium]